MWGLVGKAAIPLVKTAWNVAPAVGTALLGAEAIEGASQWSSNRKKEINQMSDSDFENYNPSLIDQYLLRTGSKEQAKGRRDNYVTDKAKNTNKYQELISEGVQLDVQTGDDLNDILAKNSGRIRKAGTQRKIEEAQTLETARWNTERAKYERGQTAQARTDALLQAAQLRADNNQIRLDGIEERRARDNKEDRRYNESIERMNRQDRKQAMSSLGAGLAALGAAFAL